MSEKSPRRILDERVQSLTTHIEKVCEVLLPKGVAKYTVSYQKEEEQ